MSRPNRPSADCRANSTPLSAQLGVVLGSERVPHPLADVEGITSVLDRSLVVALPGHDLDPESLHEFIRSFGDAHVHHPDVGVVHIEGLHEVLEVKKEPSGDRLFGGDGWHADVTFLDPAGSITGLFAVEVPPVGGDTLFANSIAAFGALSGAMQEMIRPLRAVHSYDGPGKPDRDGLTATHPVVRTHPSTGADGLYINTMFINRFDGMTEEESKPLLTFLERHITRAEFTCRVRWTPRQLVLWDNRFTLHYPVNDFTNHRRLLWRCVALEN